MKTLQLEQNVALSDVEKRLLKLFSDGEKHSKQEILGCMNSIIHIKAIKYHINNLREKIRPLGEAIICEITGRKVGYRHVILLPTVPNRRTASLLGSIS